MNEPVHFNDRVMVWPLMEGLKGLDRTGHEATLVAGMRGWMHVDVVHGSVRRGAVLRRLGLGVASRGSTPGGRADERRQDQSQGGGGKQDPSLHQQISSHLAIRSAAAEVPAGKPQTL